MVSEGDLLAGKYRVERLLGEGGMGYVVSAIHEQLEQRVAVKLLVPELAEDPDAVARFLREGRAAVRIQSEHVARVIDVGELTSGEPYLVMEFLSGRDLAQELDARETFEIGVAIDYVLQACEAVAEAHSLGVIHRDLKPANLFLTQRPDSTPLVKVLDFGISKALNGPSGQASPSLTAAQSLLGSPAYMSPEQARRPKTVDTRTDIWSLGVILYEFLGGETPFLGDAPLEVLTAVVSEPMPSLREMRPDVPAELEGVIAKCLAKKADDRHQTISEFAEALRPFAPVESQRSISRIAGILRTSLAPGESANASSTTLKSATHPNALKRATPPKALKTATHPHDPKGATPPKPLRSATPPQPLRSSTPSKALRSAADPEGPATADTEVMPAAALTPLASRDNDKDTQTDWGKSQSGTRRSRRTLVLTAAGLAVLLAIGVALFSFGDRQAATPTKELAHAAQPSEASTAPAVTVLPVPAPVAATAPAVSAAALVAPVTSAAPAGSGATGLNPAVAALRAKPRPPAAAAKPTPASDDEDPLVNRR